MSSGTRKLLLKIARSVVQSVMQQINQQLSIIQEQVRSPLEAMIAEVTNGIWIGKSADQFVSEVTSWFIPNTGRIADSCTVMTTSIQNAVDAIDAADQQVRGLVDSLDATFRSI